MGRTNDNDLCRHDLVAWACATCMCERLDAERAHSAALERGLDIGNGEFVSWQYAYQQEKAVSAKLAERVAELERDRDAAMDALANKIGDVHFADLAAAQAENVRLREALTEAVRVSGPRYLGDTQPEWVERAVAALATPSPTAALREVCKKVASKAWDYGFIERGALEVAGAPALTQESHAAKRAADVGPIVSSILGPRRRDEQ